MELLHSSFDRFDDRSGGTIGLGGLDLGELLSRARQGSAAALSLLARRCQRGPVRGRVAALALLPGLVPYQPVWPILDRVDRPSAPPAVRRAVAAARAGLGDVHERGPIYRRLQRRLVAEFLQAEAPRRPAGGLSRWEQKNTISIVISGFYDCRFELSDGCIGDPRRYHVEDFLLHFAPRRLHLAEAGRKQVPEVLARHFQWLAGRGRLLPRRARALAVRSRLLAPRYLREAFVATHPASPRALLERARSCGIDLRDAAALARQLALDSLDLEDDFAPIWERP